MRLRGHRPADYATMAETMILAVAVEIGLRLWSISALLAWLDRLRVSESRKRSTPSYQLERFTAAAYRLIPLDPTCLRESLVLYGLLRRRGAGPRLCVGVKKNGHNLAAHAWIECAGVPRQDQTPFAELESRT
jgi:transglutaminase superfamily protein